MRKLLKRIFSLRANLGSLFGGGNSGNSVQQLATPSYYTNPTYTQTTNNLANLSANILSGKLPSAYSDLGNPNSQQFQDLQSNLIGQTNAASQQNAAASGTDRSGVAATAAASSLANTLPGLDYSNLLNAQQQQQGLLSLGSGLQETVMNSSLNQQNSQNAFNQQNFQNNLNMDEYNNSYNQIQSQQLGQLFGNIIGGGLGASAVGMNGGNAGQIIAGGMTGAGMGSGGLGTFMNGMNGINNASSGVGSAAYASAMSPVAAMAPLAGTGMSMSDLAMLGVM